MKKFFSIFGILGILFSGLSHVLAVAPTAVITVMPAVASRMAPHVLHVDAAASTAGTGTLATCTFTWTFTGAGIAGGTMTYVDPRPGKSAVTYNGYVDQRGFNAAAVCRSAGNVHTVLVVTNQLGETGSTSSDTTIVADTRTYKYLDTGLSTGANDGSSTANAFRSWEGAGGAQVYLLNSGAAATGLLIKRGTTLPNSTANVITGANATNVYIGDGSSTSLGTYGSGAHPLVVDSQTVHSNCMEIRRDSENVFVENIDVQGHTNRVINAIYCRVDTSLTNITLIGSNFSSVEQGTNSGELGSACTQGYLMMNCYVNDHAEYGFYGVYSDGVLLGNTATNSTAQGESSVRLSGIHLSIDCLYSKFINPTSNKDALRLMVRSTTQGTEYAWVTRSYIIGPLELAWNADVANPVIGKFQVLEDTLSEPVDTAASNTWGTIGASSGSSGQDITVRGCIFSYTANGSNFMGSAIGVSGTANARIVIIDNTFVIRWDDTSATFVNVGASTSDVRVERNLFVSSNVGKAYFPDDSTHTIIAGNNVWYTTGQVANVFTQGNLTLANWNARPGTATDFAQTAPQIATTDITSPNFRAANSFTTVYGYAAPAGARATDYHGRTRVNGAAGAVDATIPATKKKGKTEELLLLMSQ